MPDDKPLAIFLVGFMGAGKTSVGRVLASRLGCRFVDLDDRIEARQGRTIQEIFEYRGEAAFREIESAELSRLVADLGGEMTIAALGGGAFVQPENCAMLAELSAPVIFLDAPVEVLTERCRSGLQLRPLFRDADSFRALYDARRPAYLSGTVRVETADRSVEAIADEIIAALGLRAGSRDTH